MKVKNDTMSKLIRAAKAKYAEEGVSDRKPTRYVESCSTLKKGLTDTYSSAMEMVLSRGSAVEEKQGTHASEILSDDALIDELFLYSKPCSSSTTSTTTHPLTCTSCS